MKEHAPTEWHRLFNAALNDELSDADRVQLAAVLKSSAEARQLWFLYQDNECSLAELKPLPQIKTTRVASSWFPWRPLSAAAAGIVFGMFCTSVVFGYVSHRVAMKRIPLLVFDAGLEGGAPVDQGVPHRPGLWGADSARVVMAENGVRPVKGQHMLRLEPIPREKEVRNHASRAYQVIDLREAVPLAANNEVQVVGSFCALKSQMASRFLIRAVVLDEVPEKAMKDFWPKAQSDEVVSMSQRFETPAEDQDWHAFSLKMPLPAGARTLVIVFAASAPEDKSQQAAVSYLDEVQVSLITPLSVQP